ncbi:VID27-domain-containing protein [Suhomyces tanzawaensis NRRL Y-17324]|uniref:VID27-domain-containing protein n=1 Tax=Suhomyces tanzawaensis NRRL Y-17324 TaxID=984487 RepID=A0A1E4SHB1_9ASCO|nr:VID27-domain-containing protein [Suhomyces tanzawaensis NRRL Y-17324]ODV78877.1 VID27-domain-containing protein [Suhomyces tanzawaensis NRRL Y-17324]
MNFIKKLIGTLATDEVALLPSGKLFLTRLPRLPKGELECLYNDAYASIRQTTSPYYYQLCITRVFQEGEADADGSLDGESDDDADFEDHDTPRSINDSSASKDEWTFPIVQELAIQYQERSNGVRAITWVDLNGDEGDQFEFRVDEDVHLSEVDLFVDAVYRSIYELRFQQSSRGIAREELEEFVYETPVESLAAFR